MRKQFDVNEFNFSQFIVEVDDYLEELEKGAVIDIAKCLENQENCSRLLTFC